MSDRNMVDMEDLLPDNDCPEKLIGEEFIGLIHCPFCGNEVSPTGGSITADSKGGIWQPIYCKSCKTSFWTTKEIFNSRPLEDSLRTELESANKERAYLQQQLDVAVNNVKNIMFHAGLGERWIEMACKDALAEIEALKQLEGNGIP